MPRKLENAESKAHEAIARKPSISPQPGASEQSRWFVVALLLAINLLNYVDRYVLAAVEPHIRQDLFPDGATNINALMGFLPTAFLLSYMITRRFRLAVGSDESLWIIAAE